MAGKLDKVKDEKLRANLDEVRAQLRANKPTDAVHSCSTVFLDMLRTYPKILDAKTFIPVTGTNFPTIMRWPALGANLLPESIERREPKIAFVRDHFAMSEAITYYEFTVDIAIEQGL